MSTEAAMAAGTRIPVVDFAGFGSDDAARQAATAAELRAALEDYGFLYLRHHGVPQAVLDALFAQARAFFALPLAAKQAATPAERANTRGYGGVASQALEEGRPGDLK